MSVPRAEKPAVSPISKSARDGSRAAPEFGNPRHSRVGSVRYFGCGRAALSLLCDWLVDCSEKFSTTPATWQTRRQLRQAELFLRWVGRHVLLFNNLLPGVIFSTRLIF